MNVATAKTFTVTLTEAEANAIVRVLNFANENCEIPEASHDMRVALLLSNGLSNAVRNFDYDAIED